MQDNIVMYNEVIDTLRAIMNMFKFRYIGQKLLQKITIFLLFHLRKVKIDFWRLKKMRNKTL